MIIEMLTMAVIGGLGALSLLGLAVDRDLRWTHVAVAFPAGAGLYVVAAAITTSVLGRLAPGITLLLAAALGTITAVVLRPDTNRAVTTEMARRLALVVAGVVGLVALTRLIHAARVTPDSVRYLATADTLNESIDTVFRSDLIKRHLGYPSLQLLAQWTDRLYLASLSPLFAASGGVLLIDVVNRETRTAGLTLQARRPLILAMIVFLVATNRMLYNAFYLNSHIAVAVFVLVGVVAVRLRNHAPGLLVAAGSGALFMTVSRAEGFLLALGISLALAHVDRSRWRNLVMSVIPSLIAIAYYLAVLASRVPGGTDLALTSPVLGTVAGLGGIAAIGLIPWIPELQGATIRRLLVPLTVTGALVGTALLAVREPMTLWDSVVATADNLTRSGGWGLTWPLLAVLFVLAASARVVPHQGEWTTPVWVFAATFFLLAYLRNQAFFVSAGDSGSRALAHVAFVTIGFVAVAIGNARSDHQPVDSTPDGVRDPEPSRRTRPSPPG